jgi:mxaL protein
VGARLRDPALWALGLAALALAACFLPFGVGWQRSRFEHVIVLDVTQSMNVQDQVLDGRAVSRLAYAKHALHQALQELPCGSRVGWAIFTEYRSYLLFTPVEVCANRAELRSTLAAIDGRMAWSGNSEIAKGLHSGITICKALAGTPSLVFVTDGHEAPPLEERHRPHFDDKPGEVAGLIVGVGELKPVPIPKIDPLGRLIGFWAADEVAQVDPRTLGRGASVESEKMVEGDAAQSDAGSGVPGSEHLSSLREAHLRLLAAEYGFAFHRLRGVEAFSAAMRASSLARPIEVRGDLQLPLAALAFILLLAPYASAWWPGRRTAAKVGMTGAG